jgi:hypothetical protein
MATLSNGPGCGPVTAGRVDVLTTRDREPLWRRTVAVG